MMSKNWNRFVLGGVAILFALVVTLSGLTGGGATSSDLPAAYGVAPCYTPVLQGRGSPPNRDPAGW